MLDTIDLGQLAYIAESTLLLSFLFGVVAHEAGHAATAWLLGLDMRRVSLGAGPALLRFRLAASAILFGCMGENRAELDRWSAEACALAPCAATTLTRAGVLAALNRGAEALASLRTLAAGRGEAADQFRYHLHLAQAYAAEEMNAPAQDALAAALEIANRKGPLRHVLLDIIAHARRWPPLDGLAWHPASHAMLADGA